MKVLYIYRHPGMGFSIGKVFKPVEEEMKKYAEVDSVYLPVPNYSPKGLWMNIRAARKAVSRKHYDIVHITGAEHYLIPFLPKDKLVVTVHDLGFCKILERKMTYAIKYYLFVSSLKKARFVTFISEKSEKEAADYVRLKNGRFKTVLNAVGKEFVYSPKNFNEKKPVVLHIGTKEHKNLDRSIEALHDIPCVLRIIGQVSDQQKARMAELGVEYSIGCNLTDEQLKEEYVKADIVNFPSLYEGFGMPIIEGQATGRIVITSNLEPMRTIAGDGALMVDPTNVEDIHNAYLQAMDKDVRKDVVDKGLENVKRFQLENIAYQFYSLYLTIASGGGTIKNALLLLLPWSVRRRVLNRYYHYDIHPKAHIGLAYVYPKYLKMDEGASIGHFSVAVNLDRMVLGRNVHIGRSNWITGFPTMTDSKHFAHDEARRSELIIDDESAITKHHHIDCTNTIHIGHHVTIAGYYSQLLTHSIDVYAGRQDSHPVSIGDYCFVSTGVKILGGASLPDHSVLAAGAVLNKAMEESYSLYGGVPARRIKDIRKDAKYMTREKGFVY